MSRRRARALLAVTVAVAAVTLGACGRDDFENEPRPPLPFDVSIKVTDDEVVVSPGDFGAGIATFTIVNLSDEPAILGIDGPTAGESREIPPSASDVLKTEVVEGEYEAFVVDSDAAPFEFAVGPERESAQDELLLP